jgi:hypothetical protein
MKIRFIPVLLIVPFIVSAGNQKYAIDISCGVARSSVTYFPIPSVSFYWLRGIGDHEISVEFLKKRKRLSSELKDYDSFGLGYSLLLKLPIKYLYVGPTIG